MKDAQYDLIINGGGMVGASLACALAVDGFRVALIEATAYSSSDQPSFDTRALALTYSSGLIYRNLGIWHGLNPSEATAIRQIDVSDEAGGGRVRLKSQDVGREALGWNVEARALGHRLYETLGALKNVSIFSPMTLRNFSIVNHGVVAQVGDDCSSPTNQLFAKLLVVADGSNSELRDQLGFIVRRNFYNQRALVCRVESDRYNRGSAYEHFTNSGPLALLPVCEKGYSVVWTQHLQELDEIMQVSRSEFLNKLQERFGDCAGQFEKLIGERKSYSLSLSHLKKFVRPRVVIVGNASHTVHPVAGQGFNLALRDVAALAQVLNDHRKRKWDIGSYDVLAKYERWRIRESNNVTWFTDSMIRAFSNQFPILTPARNWSLDILQTVPPAKRWLLYRTMGLYGRQPELARET